MSDVSYAFGFDDTNGKTPEARHIFRTVTGAYPAAILIIVPVDDVVTALDAQMKPVCSQNTLGVGSDGILLGPLHSDNCDYRLRILNPDGSEAEKSGNGLRIFSRYLWDQGLEHEKAFTVDTLGGTITCHVQNGGKTVTVEMGEVSLQYGPLVETDVRFPHRTNVQFLKVIDRQNIRIEIWERGAGYTLASGSNSTAAAAVVYRLGLCDPAITVQMPGGNLAIRFSQNFAATMTGPVTRVCEGVMDPEMFEGLSKADFSGS